MEKTPARQQILLVGDYNRSDFLYVARLLHTEADFFFIEYLNKSGFKNKECLQYGQVLFWKDYESAYGLLKKLNPQKVLFYFIESYNHVALNVACKVENIPTFHLEHGLRFSPAYYKMVNESRPKQQRKKTQTNILNRVIGFYDKYRNRRFFQRTAAKSPAAGQAFLKQYYAVRSSNSIHETFKKLKSPLRLAGGYISFSPIIFNYHKEVEALPEAYPVHFTGIPAFDHFYQWRAITASGNAILFIDQPLAEQGLFGWTDEYRLDFLKNLAARVAATGRQLYIKPHPLNNTTAYAALWAFEKVAVLEKEWEHLIPGIDTVLGFSSTLLLPFMAMEHICCFTMEIHPQKTGVPYSEFLLNSGACHSAASFEELLEMVQQRPAWHAQQKKAKEYFIQNWMYKFDGKSSERLRMLLLTDEAA